MSEYLDASGPAFPLQAPRRKFSSYTGKSISMTGHRGERIPVVYPLQEQFAFLTGPNLRRSLIILFAAVSFVLLIACVNVANLLLGRSLRRQKELAVRSALGSGRGRLIRQLLVESLLLSSSGALAGALLAAAAVHYFRIANPIELPPGNPVTINLQVLSFNAGLAILTALLFGLIPAWKASRVDLNDVMKAAGRGSSRGKAAGLFGNVLVATEMMLALVLLAAAGLLIQSVNRFSAVPLGFAADRVLTMEITLPKWSYSKPDQRARFYDEVLHRAAALPEVQDAALASALPLNGGRWGGNELTVQGRPEPDPAVAASDVAQLSITPDYFRAMNVPLLQGRAFDIRDQEGTEPVAIVNQALVKKYFPDEVAIGKHIRVGVPKSRGPWLTIVGVAANEKESNFFHEMSWREIPLVFRPVDQEAPAGLALVIHSAVKNPAELGPIVQRQIAALDPTVPVSDVETLGLRISRILAYPRFRAALLGTFAGFALLLASVGLYGVLAQLVAQRTQEIGVRMALGAQRRDVLGLIVRQGTLLAVGGIGAGLVVSWLLTQLLVSLLYGVKPTDPWTLAAVSLLLLLVALFATYIPARRAAKVDPVVALRYE